MASAPRRILGFTLIELMVTLAVTVVLLLISVPSFQSFRQRAALRSATESAVSFWNQARMEAAKRNTFVKVTATTSGTNYCLGAQTTTNSADTTPCNCMSTTTSDADYCNVARFPTDQTEWRSVTISGTPTLGQDTGLVVIEPKTAFLVNAADAGAVTFAGPPGHNAYLVNMVITASGRGVLCESTSAVTHMSDYPVGRQCDP